MKTLSNKVVVITGGASGIGLALAETAMAEGVRGLVIADLRQSDVDATAAALRKRGAGVVVPVAMDASLLEDVQRLLNITLEKFGSVNLACFNAGVAGSDRAQSVLNADLPQWRWVDNVNYWGVLYGSKLFGQVMAQQAKENGMEGHIVNTASMAGVVAGFMGSYSASKHACVALTERLVEDFVDAGVFPLVGASVLCPGFVSTNIWDQSKYAQAGQDKTASPNGWEDGKAFAKIPGSIPASKVAEKVFEAVQAGDILYINTHEEMFESMVRMRAEEIIAAKVPLEQIQQRLQMRSMARKAREARAKKAAQASKL